MKCQQIFRICLITVPRACTVHVPRETKWGNMKRLQWELATYFDTRARKHTHARARPHRHHTHTHTHTHTNTYTDTHTRRYKTRQALHYSPLLQA